VDNGSAHHPNTSPDRIRRQYPQVQVVHLPVHSRWLNQIEIYFSIVHRKLLSPADFASTDALARALAAFQHRYNEQAQPCRWNYTREKLERHLERWAEHEALYAEAQAARARQTRLRSPGPTRC
jgi:hypothetical protein